MPFDFNKYPQTPFFLEDNRSEEEKRANAKLINEKRWLILAQRIAIGLFLGSGLTILILSLLGSPFCD